MEKNVGTTYWKSTPVRIVSYPEIRGPHRQPKGQGTYDEPQQGLEAHQRFGQPVVSDYLWEVLFRHYKQNFWLKLTKVVSGFIDHNDNTVQYLYELEVCMYWLEKKCTKTIFTFSYSANPETTFVLNSPTKNQQV